METINLKEYGGGVNGLKEFLYEDSTQIHIGKLGGRYITTNDGKYSLNAIVNNFHQLCNQNLSGISEETANDIITKIKHLDQDAHVALMKKGLPIRIATYTRQFFGNLFYNRNKILAKLSPKLVSVTDKTGFNYLKLDTQEGRIECRTYGPSGNRKIHLTKMNTVECKLRSHLRLRNLKTIRGCRSGERMMGPLDYYGNLETPHQFLYTIEIDDNGTPQFFRKPKKYLTRSTTVWENDINDYVTKIKASWISGKDLKLLSYDQKIQLGPSLFPDSGILKIKGCDQIELQQMDATKVDLSEFKAELVKNSTPFTITDEVLPTADEFRAVTYHYEPNYAKAQVEKGGGLFLETHTFVQTMTPLSAENGGFVTLGRWIGEDRHQLELIGVQIPFGYTLIIGSECIHGDTNLEGKFLMTMTTNHVTMQKADAVFLKKDDNLSENVSVLIRGADHEVNPLNNYTEGLVHLH